jgi:AcrR family transcriptional regulator
MPAGSPKRSYDSSRRSLQAAQTRDAVVQAAIELFSTTRWAGTTLADIASAAGVSVETIYNGFGSKKGLLRAAIDFSIVGDAEPVPLRDRPEYLALGDGSPEERIAGAAAMTATIHARAARVWRALMEAASADEEVDGWRVELEQGRHQQIAESVDRIVGRSLGDHVTTMAWILYSSETYLKLVQDRGFTREEYEAFLVDATTRVLAGGS